MARLAGIKLHLLGICIRDRYRHIIENLLRFSIVVADEDQVEIGESSSRSVCGLHLFVDCDLFASYQLFAYLGLVGLIQFDWR